MDRTRTSATEHRAAVRFAGAIPLQLLLPAAAGERRKSAADASHRRTLFGVSLLREPPFRRRDFRRMAGSAPVRRSIRICCGGWPSRAPIGYGAAILAMCNLRRGFLFDRGTGLAQPFRVERGALPQTKRHGSLIHWISGVWFFAGGQYGGRLVPPLGAGSSLALVPAGNLPLRPGSAVHGAGISAHPQAARYPHRHGWAQPRPGQRFHRAAVAFDEVRTDLSRRLPRGRGDRLRLGPLLRLVQSTAASPGAGLSNARGALRSARRLFGRRAVRELTWKSSLPSTYQMAKYRPNNSVHFIPEAEITRMKDWPH